MNRINVSPLVGTLSNEVERSLSLLIEGNKRFVQGLKSVESIASVAKIKDLAAHGQKPFAIVLACSDSRVPTETLFDCGLGNLFVIRVAGNVISPDLVASIEYAATQLGTPLCLVMGHTGCGAVKAALDLNRDSPVTSRNIAGLLEKIIPAIVETKSDLSGSSHECFSDLCVLNNVQQSTLLITEMSDTIRQLIGDQKLAIVGSLYDLNTGIVHFNLDDLKAKLMKSSKEAYVPKRAQMF